MARKMKERARLLELYKATGDADYRQAAECLKIGLREFLEAQPRRPGRPQKKESSIPWTRLARIHELVTAGASVLAAAQQEVDEHGAGQSRDATVAALRKEYALRRPEVADMVAMVAKMIGDEEFFLSWTKTRPKTAEFKSNT
jgi:hypothetical protein